MRRVVQRSSASASLSLIAASSSLQGRQCFIRSGLVTRSLPIRARQIHHTPVFQLHAAAAEAHEQQSDDGPITDFKDLGSQNVLHPRIVRTLTESMGLEHMTEVQKKTINEAIDGQDIIAQARTGTGKTLAFLIPILQNIIAIDPSLAQPAYRAERKRSSASDIRALIISPTRELAEQIAAEARKLVRGTSVIVQSAVGGTQKRAGLAAIQRQGCHILVGTPGRLKDILSDPYSRVEAPDLSALVLDEADRLMDQGFWPEIQQIVQLLPAPAEMDRQTMLFSATVPKEVVTLVRSTLKPGFKFVQCVADDENPTHERVPQHVVMTEAFENNHPAMIELCTRGIEASKQPDVAPFKAIVYFNSTAEVTLAESVLANLESSPASSQSPSRFGRGTSTHPWGSARVLGIHSRLSQAQRTHAADTFRRCETGVLLSSDVTARGMDFPNVTHVIQVGLPTSRDQYIHRIGRTGRAGREGQGWLIITKLEAEQARQRLRKLPIRPDSSLETASIDLSKEAQLSKTAGDILNMYQQAMRSAPMREKSGVYSAYIGVYGWIENKQTLIDSMNQLSQFGFGLQTPPSLSPGLISRLGLGRVRGINSMRSQESWDDGPPGADRGRGAYRGSSGRGDFRSSSGRGDFRSSSGRGDFRSSSGRGDFRSSSGRGDSRGSYTRSSW